MPTQESEIYLALLIGACFLLLIFLVTILNLTNNYHRIRKLKNQMIKSEIQGSEKERLRISQKLHDDINPSLAIATMYLQMMQLKDEKNKEMLAKSLEILNLSIGKIRNLSHELSPYSIAEKGITAAVDEYIKKLAELYNIRFVYKNQLNTIILSENEQIQLFRIIQEALANAIKYAQANEIRVGFFEIDNSLHLVVQDNGIGFGFSKQILFSSLKGIGLKNIYNRAQSINGVFNLYSKKNEGTTLVIVLQNRF